MTKKLKIDKKKLRKISPTKNPFLSLAGSIIYQQISTGAGNAIYKKFLVLFEGRYPSPKLLLKLSNEQLRGASLSPQKLSYMRDLAEKFLDKTIDPRFFSKMTDQEIKAHLIQVKGIGSWTADMFLIFALNRQNVLPVGDLGIRKGFQKAFKLKKLPSEMKMKTLAKHYNHKYTELSLYLWGIL